MSLIQISNPALRLMVILQLMEHLEYGNLSTLLDCGIEPSQIDHLRTLQLPDLLRLAQMEQPTIGVALDPDGLDRAFSTLTARATHDDLLTYFLVNQASVAMLRRFFKIGRDTITRYRTAYASVRPVGRTGLPDIETRESILVAWRELAHETDLRRRYRALHQRFSEHTLEALYAVVNEHGEQA